MPTKTQRKKATSGGMITASKTVHSPLHADGGESKVLKSKQLLLDEQYRDLFDNTSDMIQSVAPDGHFLYTNKAWREVLGYSEKEVAHLKIWDIISPESMDHCMELFKKVIAGEDVRDIEAVFVAKDGSQIAVEGNAHCRFVEGKPVGTQGFFRDVTKRKQAEAILATSEAKYRSFVETTVAGVASIDLQGNFVFVNEAACEMIGYSREELIGKAFADFIHLDDVKGVMELFLEAIKHSELRPELEFRVVRRDGRNLWLYSCPTPILYGDTFSGASAIIIDITERKQAEEALRQSEERYRILFGSKLDGICVMDETMKVLLVNQAAVDIFGFDSIDEALGANPFDFIPSEERERVLDIVKKDMFEHNLRQVNEFRLTNKSGKDIWIGAVGTLTEYQGKLAGLISFRDITERKQAEETLRQSEERYRTVLEEMEEGYFETDINGNFTVINEATCRVLGYPREGIIGTNYRVFVTKEYVDAVYQVFNQIYQTGMPIRQLAWEILEKDRGRKFIEASVAPMRDQEGQLIGFRGIGRDVTASRKSEERYQTIIRAAMDGFWLTDMQGHFLDVNEAYCRLIGYSRDELLNMSISDVEAVDTQKHIATHIRKIKKIGYDRFETRHRRKDGEIVDVEVSVNYLSTDGGRQFVFIRDITERKKAEEALADEATRRRILIEQSRDGIVVLDENGKVYEVNQRFAEMLGYSLEEARELNVWDWEFQFPREQVQEMIRSVDEKGDHFETRHRRKDGTTYDVEISTNGAIIAGQKLIFCVCRDITARKQAEEALTKSEERYRTVLEQMEEAYFEVDIAGNFTFLNDATCRQLGYSREELMGVNYRVYTSKGDVQQVYETFNQVYRTGKPYKGLPVVRIRKDGSRLSTETSAFPLRNERGDIIGFRGIAVDVTERKKAEEALRLSEQNFHDVIENSPLGIRVLNKDWKTLYINRALLDMWGYNSIEELEAVPRKQRYTPQGYAERMEIVKKRKRGEPAPLTYETRIVRSDGQIRVLSVSYGELLWNGERQYQLVYQDVTERVQAERAKQDAEKIYRLLADNMTDTVWMMDMNLAITYVSPSAARIRGYTIEEIMAMPLEKHLTPQSFTDAMEMYAQVLKLIKEGRRDSIEERYLNLEFIRKDGSTFWVECHFTLIRDENDQPASILVVGRDVTERKQAEEKVKKLYSLQTAIRYINESLLKVDDERALFERVCRFLTDVEFIRFCWIGLTDKESLEVKPVAYSGFEDGYLSSLKIHLVKSRGPVGVAIKTRQPCTVADIENDPGFPPWREAALKRGYASSLAVPLIHDNEVIGALSVYSSSKNAFGDAEIVFLSEAVSDIALGIRTLRLRRELQQSLAGLGKALQGTVSALASVAEVRDPYTAGHQQRVTRLAVAIATEMGLPQEQIEGIHVAGTLHDVGKLYVPAEILSKPGKLSEVEFNLVKIHSQASYDILKSVEFPWPVAQIVLQHHERLDGSGYPQGLKGEDILLEAKILAVADVVEAMASHRPYRPALGMGQALDEISKNSGTLYDPEVVDACFKLFYDKEFKLD